MNQTASVENTKKFSFDDISDFASHINSSIPTYDILNNLVLSISEYFIHESKNIYDIGCSDGRLLSRIKHPAGYKIGLDNSKLLPDNDKAAWRSHDISQGMGITNACLVYSIFTMQFLSFPVRRRALREIYDGLVEGGAFIWCEKVYAANSFMQEIFTFTHYDSKRRHFRLEEIYDKEFDLRRIMRPMTDADNCAMLEETGFNTLCHFWRYLNFVGYIAIKGKA
jgi:tRNA (cmo5U34)-methyltransferase